MASSSQSSNVEGSARACELRRLYDMQRVHPWACPGALLHRMRCGLTFVRIRKSSAPQPRQGGKSSKSHSRCLAIRRLTMPSTQKCHKCMWKQVNTEPGESSAPTKASLGLVEYSDSEDSSDSNPYEEVRVRLREQ